MTEKVGNLPDPGQINPGDPGHIAVHDEMAEIVQEAADAAGIILDPPAPPPAVVGQYGHVDAHNRLLANLEQLAKEGIIGGGGSAPGAAVIGNSSGPIVRTSYTGDGTNGDLDQDYDVYTFTGSGTLTVTEAGYADVLVVGGGGGGAAYASGWSTGGGGGVRWGLFPLVVPGHTVTIGAGGAQRAHGGHSKLDGVLMSGGGSKGDWKNGGFLTIAWPAQGGGGSGGGIAAGSADHNVDARAHGGGAGGTLYGVAETDGIVINYDNASIERGKGGVGNGEGAANTGNGGGTQNVAGGSGVVIVRVRVATGSFFPRSQATFPRTAHAAQIENGQVTQVIVIPHLDDDDQKITEYCNSLGLPGTWVDTSYTGSRRGKYAGVGDTFVSTKAGGEFISPVVDETATADLNGESE